MSTMLLSMREVIDYGPVVLDGLETLDVLCIDDVHLVAGNDAWEKGLFNFFNRFNEPGKYLVVTADLLPDMLHINLPDLVSRLKWGTTLQIRSMSDDDKAEALVRRAHMRGLELTDECARFLLTRLSRARDAREKSKLSQADKPIEILDVVQSAVLETFAIHD